ncbi:hypothetical protein BAG01nite_46320 [Brevibacillus agri]|uniref:Uncharacterized protein n=2 Tax=Brevibacillus agri TaxID=51101 RepID=A0A3M8AH93_9BACL|nr:MULTISPECIES: DUF6173 family protein [Brevibacillus]ELK42086.1 hypothetical protein D478_10340 [Brevibacillus agri BAB-2500]EJL42186.1 hypothetical protein PMI08_03357 [Brevibacillus sp. CF112]MBG9566948.1 hypothetical protein [Brevibacillus agri]MCG5254271.1 DUF6173 family protein [Brevibacillus agri]MDR9506018.1 DUF6173 family protein [Brevibacillus agri]
MAVNEYSLPTSPQAVKLKDNELPVFEVQPDQNLASEFHKRLIQMIAEFELALDEQHEVGMRLVSFGQNVTLRVEGIGYYNPSLIRFFGTTETGAPVELIQHVTQISFLLMAVKKADPANPPKRIGFKAPEEDEKEDV